MKKLLFLLLLPFLAYAAEEIPYGQAYPFEQCFVDNTTGIALESTITFQDADITISQNGTEASPAGTAARFNDNGKCFDFNLLSTETDTPFVTAIFVDNAGDVWMPTWRNFITVGHPSAGIISYDPYMFAAVADATGTTTLTDLTGAASAVNDHYQYRVLRIYDASTGESYEPTISAYNGTTNIATHTPIPAAVVSGDGLIVLAQEKAIITVDASGTVNTNIVSGDTDSLDADVFAAGAIGASELAADAITKIMASMAFDSGTCDSGSTTTCVDAAAFTTADADYYAKGFAILFTSGTLDKQSACIYDFDPATDKVTFRPALTQAVTTHTYILLAAPICGLVIAP